MGLKYHFEKPQQQTSILLIFLVTSPFSSFFFSELEILKIVASGSECFFPKFAPFLPSTVWKKGGRGLPGKANNFEIIFRATWNKCQNFYFRKPKNRNQEAVFKIKTRKEQFSHPTPSFFFSELEIFETVCKLSRTFFPKLGPSIPPTSGTKKRGSAKIIFRISGINSKI